MCLSFRQFLSCCFLVAVSISQCNAAMVSFSFKGSSFVGGPSLGPISVLDVTVEDTVANTVKMTATLNSATVFGTGLQVKEIAFNLNSLSGSVTSVTAASGSPFAGFSFDVNNKSVSPLDGFDLLLDFQPPALEFGNSPATYTIVGAGLLATMFNSTTVGGVFAVAHIGGFSVSGQDSSGKYGGTVTPPGGPEVPEPAMIGLCLSGLVCSFGAFRKRLKRSVTK